MKNSLSGGGGGGVRGLIWLIYIYIICNPFVWNKSGDA